MALTHLNVLPIGETRDSNWSEGGRLVGTIAHGPDGKSYRLVSYAQAITSPTNLTVMYSAATDVRTVTRVTGTTDRVAGVIPKKKNGNNHDDIASGDYGWLMISGRVEVVHGDDGNTITAGDYVSASADTDTGKVDQSAGSGATYDEGVTFAICLETSSTDGGTPMVELLGPLKG